MKAPPKTNSSSPSKRIIFIWNYLEWGGAQIYFLSIIKHAINDWEVTVLIPKDSKPEIIDFIKQTGAEINFIDARIDVSPAMALKEKISRHWTRLKAEFKTYQYISELNLKNTVLHVETAPWQSWLFLWLLSRRADVFVTMHNALPLKSGWRTIIWKKRLNFLLGLKKFHLFTANRNAKNSIKEIIEPDKWEKIIVTRASIDPEQIENVLKKDLDRKALKEKHRISADKFLVLAVGQFVDRKGRWVFLEAAKLLIERDKGMHFAWLTPAMPSESDLRRIKDFDLGEDFQLILSETVGKKREDILNFFRLADVFALPSLFEGLPIAILEAMALGIPTVSTNITAIPEAVIDMETGILIEPNDPEQLADAVRRIKNDSRLAGSLASKGKEFVADKFDERKAAARAIEAYRLSLEKK